MIMDKLICIYKNLYKPKLCLSFFFRVKYNLFLFYFLRRMSQSNAHVVCNGRQIWQEATTTQETMSNLGFQWPSLLPCYHGAYQSMAQRLKIWRNMAMLQRPSNGVQTISSRRTLSPMSCGYRYNFFFFLSRFYIFYLLFLLSGHKNNVYFFIYNMKIGNFYYFN